MATANATSRPRRRPPFTVLLVSALGILLGAVGVVHGVGLIRDRDDAAVIADTGLSSGSLLVHGIVTIVIGAVVVVLSANLLRGDRFARGVFGLFAALHLVQGLVIVFGWYDVSPWEGLVSIVVSVLLLVLLFRGPAVRAYFAAG